MKSELNIIAVVVTYNRLDLLKQVVGGLRNQSRKPNSILIINNDSTDGTESWLSSQSDLIMVKQENLGSSGGQYRGMKEAYDRGADYIWIMDDDVVAEKYCLEYLMNFLGEKKIIVPARIAPNGNYILCDTLKINLSNPLKNIWEKIVKNSDFKNELIQAEAIAFEGPIIHRSIIERIGLPEKKFFIFADDTEYSIRARKENYQIFISRDAKLNRLLELPDESEFSWKNYYMLRNIIAIDVLHGNFLVRWIRPWGYFIKWILRFKSYDNFKTILNAFKDGYFYRSGNN